MTASLFDRLEKRAVEIHVADHLRARLNRGEKIRVKLGLDPTAPDIHVGHLVVLDVLRSFQDEGHTVVVIIGDYTAMIGDPSGRSETRPVLTREQVDANARTYFDQIYMVLDRVHTEVHGNSEWLAEMGAADVLRLLGKATLQQVLQREDFAGRLKSGAAIGAHEILYPFNQAYDSVAIKADLEIGGTDQLFNLMFGRDIQRAYAQQPQDIAVFPLIEGLDGTQKMSKSLGNYIGISEAPEEIYGKTMSIPDTLTEKYLRLISGLSDLEVEKTLALQPRDTKAGLARQLVARLHGHEAAKRAEDAFVTQFVRREAPAEVPFYAVGGPMDPVTVLVKSGIAKSGNDARRLVEQGGFQVNGEKRGFERLLISGDLIYARRRYLRIK